MPSERPGPTSSRPQRHRSKTQGPDTNQDRRRRRKARNLRKAPKKQRGSKGTPAAPKTATADASGLPSLSKKPSAQVNKSLADKLKEATDAVNPATTVCAKWALALEGCSWKTCKFTHKFPKNLTEKHLNDVPGLLKTPLPATFSIDDADRE